LIKKFLSSVILKCSNLNQMIFQIGWAALAAIFTFSIAMVVWGRNGDGSIDI
jgi:cytochrome b6-f complex subunit 8